MEVVVLDSDEECSPPSLTKEQRERIVRQKELALARRKARLSGSPQSSSRTQATAYVDVSGSPQAMQADSLPEFIDLGVSDDEVTEVKASNFRYFRTAPMGCEGSRARVEDTSTWRAVRKRPSPGQSSGVSSLRSENSCKQAKSSGMWVPDLTPPVKANKITLSLEQLQVLEAVHSGKSVFVTGSAGTGKSYIMEFAIRVLKKLYGPSSVYVTASTGLAACSLSGTTLHSFAGVGLGTGRQEELSAKVLRNKEKKARWMNAQALVIDEISMIDAALFDKIDYVGRSVRNCSKPFGGLQLVVTGDFFQLPPVQRAGETKSFAFNAKCWKECFDLQMELTHVFRQSDTEFVDMLNQIRCGNCSPAVHERLKACTDPSTEMGIELTKLYPRREDVDKENGQNLRALDKETVTFYAKDTGRTQFLGANIAEPELTLAVGSQVMLIKNLETMQGLVNGARGVLVGFLPPEQSKSTDVTISPGGGWPVVRFADGMARVVRPEGWSVMEGDTEVAKRMQVPLILAWALSVHKCQGMTLDRVQTDLSRAFEYGMVYVALSRVRSLDGLLLLGFDPKKIKVHPEVVEFYKQLKSQGASRKLF